MRGGKPSSLEKLLSWDLRASKLPAPQEEFAFHPERKWRFDFAWPSIKVAVECEGGIWVGGRHTRAKGFESDCEKYNAAQLMGWTVFRFTHSMIDSGEAIKLIKAMVRPNVVPLEGTP